MSSAIRSCTATGFICGLFVSCSVVGRAAPASKNGTYVATAYSVTGITASGEWTHRHVVAADPDILPIGSRVHIKRAGRYSGEYVVADTGAKIQGRRLDIYMPNTAECLKFGVHKVRVRVLELGDGTKAATVQADHVVKKDVATDVSKGVVGNAATEVDWNAQGAATKKAAETGVLHPAVGAPATGPAATNPAATKPPPGSSPATAVPATNPATPGSPAPNSPNVDYIG